MALLRPVKFQLELPLLRAPRPKPKRQKKQYPLRRNDPQLYEIWAFLQEKFFPDRPDVRTYTVDWSKRSQKRTLASCNMSKKHISVARELDDPRWQCWLEPLLYHEMCHAVLAPELVTHAERTKRKTPWHGAKFKALEKRHPGIAHLDRWIRSGGWATAIRSDRSKRMWQNRRDAR